MITRSLLRLVVAGFLGSLGVVLLVHDTNNAVGMGLAAIAVIWGIVEMFVLAGLLLTYGLTGLAHDFGQAQGRDPWNRWGLEAGVDEARQRLRDTATASFIDTMEEFEAIVIEPVKEASVEALNLADGGDTEGAADVLARWADGAIPRLGHCRRDLQNLRDNASEMLRPEAAREVLGEIDDAVGAFLDAARLLVARDLEPGYVALQGAAAKYAVVQAHLAQFPPESA